ncbi:MAG: hypothetical protein C0608_00245 [Deltaproteobacteria bacterium]|nr:MAG: hypothetical protein C0608_00245 [Deltaproteobacteria bacterium]
MFRLLSGLLFLSLAACSAPETTGDLHYMPSELISSEVTWEGRVVVDRIVIVGRSGTLRIAPGTKILFEKVDWDGDGIGDAEITVEGKLIADGTPQEPILMASAEVDPSPGDWKYLHINFARGARLSNVRISDAFSGIQVHYSKVEIDRCDFRHNIDGIRFSTADLTVKGSLSMQNRHGIRFEERGHPALISGNRVTDNEVGIFAVTECKGTSTFKDNDFSANETPVKMGWEQHSDIDLTGNWWGAPADKVKESILDGKRDSTLGVAVIAPVMGLAPDISEPFYLPYKDPDWERATKRDLR